MQRTSGILNEYDRSNMSWLTAWLDFSRVNSNEIVYPRRILTQYEREECARRARERD